MTNEIFFAPKPLKRFRVAFSFLCVEVQVPRG